MNASLQKAIDDTIAATQRGTDVKASAVTAITGLVTKNGELVQALADAQAANDPVAIQAAVTALVDNQTVMEDGTAKLAAAIPANTPSA